eukprot:1051187-Pleurochrysis_carterae.AAC.1
MGITLGFCPVRDSKEERLLRGGPVVRFNTSTECEAAKVQKDAGAPAAVKLARVASMTDLIALSATPLSWCT